MKSLEEIKNEVAVKHGYKDWHDADLCTSYDQSDALVSEAMQEYAKQLCDEQIIACAEQFVDTTMDMNIPYGEIRDNILNTPNVVTTK